MDSRSVSLSKALSWRVVAWTITALVGYGVIKNGQFAILLGTLDSLIKIGAYYGHERGWMWLAQHLEFFGGHAKSGSAPAGVAHHQRRISIFKALSWRLAAFSITVAVTVLVTRDLQQALTLGFVDSLIKIVVYYGHERMWIRILERRVRASAEPSPAE